jgi:hypothetical protein
MAGGLVDTITGWSPDLGVESLLGPDAEGELSQDLRDRLALASRYIANWYRATKGSDDEAVWWQRIDAERAKVDAAYRALNTADNYTFPGMKERALYADAAMGWPQLWRDLNLSADTLPSPGLLSSAADLVTTIAETPAAIIPFIGDQIGKAAGGAAAKIWDGAWPLIVVVAGVGLVYVFRAPLVRLAGKVGA